jgi:hypothetical protein
VYTLSLEPLAHHSSAKHRHNRVAQRHKKPIAALCVELHARATHPTFTGTKAASLQQLSPKVSSFTHLLRNSHPRFCFFPSTLNSTNLTAPPQGSSEDHRHTIKMNATQLLIDWIAEHPYQTFFQVVNGVVLLTPAAATVPLFSALGLSAGGPVAGMLVALLTTIPSVSCSMLTIDFQVAQLHRS